MKSDRILKIFAETAPKIIGENFTPSCCLNATRCFIEAMKSFNILATPVVVETIAFNRVWEEQVRANDDNWPRNAREKQKFLDAGGYSIAVGGANDANGWPHHIVAIANGHLVDASAGQMSRPKFDMTIPQVMVVPVPASFVLVPQFAISQSTEGVALGYKVQPGIPYAELPGWQLAPHNLRVAKEFVDAIRRAL